MSQQPTTGFAFWECTPTLDSPATDRVHLFGRTLFVREESVYGPSQRAMTVSLVPFERSGQQESVSFNSSPRLQAWDNFQWVVPEPASTQNARMRATPGTLPELDWEY